MPVKLIKLMCSGNYSAAVAVPNRCDVRPQETLSKPCIHDVDGYGQLRDTCLTTVVLGKFSSDRASKVQL